MGGDGIGQWDEGVSIGLVWLANGTFCNEVADECGQFWPPIVSFEDCFGVESSHMI